MLKSYTAAIRQWLSSKLNSHKKVQNNNINPARRGFFKKAAVGLTSVTATAGLSKVVVDSLEKTDLQEHYTKDSIAGEQELMNREYVLMSNEEKTDMMQTFIKNYTEQS
ncbi:MAG: hypothetical protein QM504_08285 [Pseudomonadota bacterium]